MQESSARAPFRAIPRLSPHSGRSSVFKDRLQVSLSLVIGSDTFVIPAGSIERMEIDARTHGFEAEVTFIVSSDISPDVVFPSFTTSKLAQATLSIANGVLVLEGAAPPPLSLMGFVTERRVSEVVTDDVDDLPIVERRYVVRFVDPAQAHWRQHRPLELHAGKSMREVIELHRFAGMTLTYDWSLLDDVHDVLCLGLGGESKASFYDLVIWYVHEHNGVFELKADTGAYRIGQSKPRGGTAKALTTESVGAIRIALPDPPRYGGAVHNPFTEAATAKADLPNDLAVTGVRRDTLAHTSIASRFDRRVQIETDRNRRGEHLIEVTFRECPPVIPSPGDLVRVGEEFSDKIHPAGKTSRTIALRLRAESIEDDEGGDLEDEIAPYMLDISAIAELPTDPVPRLPPFRRPPYPVLVEGRVVSASGAEKDRTWYMMEGENDSLHRYVVDIPLWNKKVVAPFVPGGVHGHLFFPAYEGQRALVSLELTSARIERFLDWARKLGNAPQGNQVVMGHNDANTTTITHVYEEARPVLRIERTLAGDKEKIEIFEGTLFMEVKEEETTPAATETYNLTPTVEAANAQVSSEVRSSVTEVSGSFGTSMSSLSTGIDDAGAEVGAGVGAAVSTLTGKLEAAQAELDTLGASGDASVEEVKAQVAAAKASIKAVVEED
jgi:hypothetical protein